MMNVHNAVFTVDEGPDRFRVAFDRRNVDGKTLWVVHVTVNNAEPFRKTYRTTSEPNPKSAARFARQYGK